MRLWHYCLAQSKVFFHSLKNGIMYTALIDLAIYLYRTRKVIFSGRPHI